MKKIPVWLIIVWSILFIGALVPLFLGGPFAKIAWLRWVIALPLLIGDGIWIAIAVTKVMKKRKKKHRFSGNRILFQRLSREADEAVHRYLKTATSRGWLKRSTLYERPWFLLCGLKGTGKTSLLNGSGLHFPVSYPSEADGLVLEGGDHNSWRFANEAVWIDTPGAVMDDERKDEWQALAASLAKVRSERPVDGVALVVNAHKVLTTDDDAGIRDLAKQLRRRIDELIELWGIEFPVYLLFNYADQIPGFNEYFRDILERSENQVFGATFSVEKQKQMPRFAFAEEFNLLCKSLTDLRLYRLSKEKDGARKRMICRFVIHFEGMRDKLGALVTELFKPSSYVGRPLFRGFYFTSCRTVQSEQDSPSFSEADVGMTIASHPLNPKRMFKPETGSSKSSAPRVASSFVLPLFRKIMVHDRTLVKTTHIRSRKELIRHYAVMGGIVAATLVVGILFAIARSNSSKMLNEISSDIAKLESAKSSLPDRYEEMGIIASNIARLQKYEDTNPPFILRFGYYKGEAMLDELKTAYFKRAQKLIVVPAVRYLEYSIRGGTQSYGELTGDEHSELYASLKTYLSISEAVANRPKDIDTIFLRMHLQEAVKRSLLAAFKSSRLPQSVETNLQDNIGRYLFYLKRQEFPLIQENQRLVAQARRRLRRLPSAQSLYETVINRISQEIPEVTLDEILNRSAEGILKSEKTISSLFTQGGWEEYVQDAITDASKNPYNIDWVIGLSEDEVPESALNKKKLRSDMVAAYLEDYESRWFDFLTSIRMEPFGDLPRCARIMQELVNPGSEMEKLFTAVAEYTVLKPGDKAEEAGGKVLEAAGKIKATKKYARKAQKAEGMASSIPFSRKSPFEMLDDAFEPFRTFTRSTGGALSGFQGYRDQILTLVEKLKVIEEQGVDKAVVVFNGKEDDPLLASWRYTQNALASMPEKLSESLTGILITPIEYTGISASDVLTRALNKQWQSEIVRPFTNRLAGRYPFNKRGEDASFDEVMDFFRPSTGTFWGFYDRTISSYIIKTSSGWMVRSLGSLNLNFNPQLAQSLSAAERIRDVYFKNDGTLRTIMLTVSPLSTNKHPAQIVVSGQSFDMPSGGETIRISWPTPGGTQSAQLRVKIGDDFTQDLSFGGAWGLMKLIDAARVNKINSSTLAVKWQINVQNMYMVQQNYRFQASGSDHPFADDLFEHFECPTVLIVEPEKTDTALR
ncbi:MAG: type VI secretion system membrane subunit TssM [Chitinivibrionales bacterium]|nr:type VI secretion system membrane subunit TssM [Chitinivibrionales bacterium]